MNDFDAQTSADAGIERLLTSLAGIVSAHVVADTDGEIREIHILATPDLHPKQIVRNVESALSAGLGIRVDRRVVSVAQIRADAGAAAAEPDAPVAPAAPAAPPGAASSEAAPRNSVPRESDPRRPEPEPNRLVFIGYDARIDAARQAMCEVRLRWGPDEFAGQGQGPDTARGRAEAAARAVFAALASCRGTDRLSLEGAVVVEAQGTSYVLVAARSIQGRQTVPLTGVAHLEHSPEEAAILAALQATNHWRASPR